MPTTPNMGLNKPTPLVTIGPEWADLINDVIDLIDSHDHTIGNGVKINSAGMQFNVDVPLNNQRIMQAKALSFQDQDGLQSNTRALYASGGNLYYKNSGGVPIQLTNDNSPSSVPLVFFLVASLTYTISASDQNRVLGFETGGGAKTITLPTATSVGFLSFIVKDVAGDAGTNFIRVTPTGGNLFNGLGPGTFPVVQTNGGSARIMSDGFSRWWTI